jgi:hypothetical protein
MEKSVEWQRTLGVTSITWGRVAARRFSPVVYTCGVSALRDLRRTTAFLSGL